LLVVVVAEALVLQVVPVEQVAVVPVDCQLVQELLEPQTPVAVEEVEELMLREVLLV
jgi:hypothetical protein